MDQDTGKNRPGSLFKQSAPTAAFTLATAFIWGLIAHAYAFLNGSFSHDAMTIYASVAEEQNKLRLGRILVPVYRTLTRGSLEIPWLIGLLGLLWIGLSCCLIIRIFDIRSRMKSLLISGLMITNITVSTVTAGYLYEMDFHMFSVLLAVLAVWFWKTKKKGFLWGSFCIFAVLGIYQCNISIAVVLIIMDCLLSCLKNEDAGKTFKRGLLGAGMLLIGSAIYLISLRIVLSVFHIEMGDSYNSIGNIVGEKSHSLLRLLGGAIGNTVKTLLQPACRMVHNRFSVYALFVSGLGIVTLCLIVHLFRYYSPNRRNLLLGAVLLCLLPLGANAAYVLNDGIAHDLMKYAVWMLLLLPVLLWNLMPAAEQGKPGMMRWPAWVMIAFFGLVFLQNAVLSNSLYLKKELEHKAMLSYMTCVAEDISRTEGYVPGHTEICLVGVPVMGGWMSGFETLYQYTGSESPSAVTYYETAKEWLAYIMNLPVCVSSAEKQAQIAADAAVRKMPNYPAEGSIGWMGDTLIVHFR